MMIIFVIVIFVAPIFAVKDIGELNLIKVDSEDNGYKKLLLGDDGFLSAPPMVVLDVEKLKKYQCYRNMRSYRWSFGIPIIFWNQTYMDKISESVKKIQFFKKFHSNMSELILPPCGIFAYRLNWRRQYELFDDDLIQVDSYWYNTAPEYVLPKYHTFVLEFKSANNSEEMCKSTKLSLVNETMQSQELAVDFVMRKQDKRTVPTVRITIGDIKDTKAFKESKCESKEKCLVSHEYAEKWAYEVSSNILRRLNIIHLSLQKDIFDKILNDYLCKDKVSISELELKIALVRSLSKTSNNDMGCNVPDKVYVTSKQVCNREFNRMYGRYDTKCLKESVNFVSEVAVQVDPTLKFDIKSEMTILVKRLIS